MAAITIPELTRLHEKMLKLMLIRGYILISSKPRLLDSLGGFFAFFFLSNQIFPG